MSSPRERALVSSHASTGHDRFPNAPVTASARFRPRAAGQRRDDDTEPARRTRRVAARSHLGDNQSSGATPRKASGGVREADAMIGSLGATVRRAADAGAIARRAVAARDRHACGIGHMGIRLQVASRERVRTLERCWVTHSNDRHHACLAPRARVARHRGSRTQRCWGPQRRGPGPLFCGIATRWRSMSTAARRASRTPQKRAGARLAPGGWLDGAVPPRHEEHPRAIMAWLATLPKPCSVFACCDAWARIVGRYARVGGLRIPEDIALVGVDNDAMECETMAPPRCRASPCPAAAWEKAQRTCCNSGCAGKAMAGTRARAAGGRGGAPLARSPRAAGYPRGAAPRRLPTGGRSAGRLPPQRARPVRRRRRMARNGGRRAARSLVPTGACQRGRPRSERIHGGHSSRRNHRHGRRRVHDGTEQPAAR